MWRRPRRSASIFAMSWWRRALGVPLGSKAAALGAGAANEQTKLYSAAAEAAAGRRSRKRRRRRRRTQGQRHGVQVCTGSKAVHCDVTAHCTALLR